jgi:hypothetical protein
MSSDWSPRARLRGDALTDDNAGFDLGSTLDAATKTGVVANHARCTLCMNPGIDYAGITSVP